MNDTLPAGLRDVVRAAMNAPDQRMPFAGDKQENILSAETLGNMTRIVQGARARLVPDPRDPGAADLETMYLAGCYYTMRCRYLPAQDSYWDFNAALFLFSAVHAVRPDALPHVARELFREELRPPMPAVEILHAVAMALFAASARTRDVAGVRQTFTLLAETLQSAPEGAVQPAMTFNHGSVCLELSRLSGDPKAATAAVVLMRQAIAAVPDGEPVSPDMLRGLAAAQRAAPPTSQTSNTTATSASDDNDPAGLINLANLLRIRFESSGELDDVDRAIGLLRQVADVSQDAEIRRAANTVSSAAHLAKAVSLGDPADLDRALAAARAALDGANPLSGHYAQILTHLAAVLLHRFERYEDSVALTEAVRHLELAVASTAITQHDYPVMAIKLAVALRYRAELTGQPADTSRAIALLRSVIGQSSPDSTDQTHRDLARLELAHLLQVRSRTAADLLAAAELFETIAHGGGHDIRTRLHAAALCGLDHFRLGDLERASSAFALALNELLPKSAALALGRPSREARLREVPSLACAAAAVELRAGRPAEALVRLEQGRGVLLAQALGLRGQTAELATAAPRLAEDFERVCRDLASESGPSEQRRASAARFDQLVREIRALPGFSRFQLYDTWEQLREAAVHGPVVVINVSTLGCDALVLERRRGETTATLRVVPLSGVTEEDIDRRAGEFTAAALAMSSPDSDLAARISADETMTDTLHWLWENITGRILTELGLDRTHPSDAKLPRIWWCPTGLLSLLPLHAARNPQDGTYADDRVISSYIPTLRSLLHARRRSPSASPRLVSIGVTDSSPSPAPSGLQREPLTFVAAELAAVAQVPWPQSRLVDGEATPEAVLAALRTHSRAHLACHGEHDPGDPSSSKLWLHGGALTLRELAAQRLPDAEFAFLSACHSSAGSRQLVDEAITLASAFQLCGYRHVIGALWQVQDEIAPALAHGVYQSLAASGSVDQCARALHQATRALRGQAHYAAPFFWASLIHLGP